MISCILLCKDRFRASFNRKRGCLRVDNYQHGTSINYKNFDFSPHKISLKRVLKISKEQLLRDCISFNKHFSLKQFRAEKLYKKGTPSQVFCKNYAKTIFIFFQ